MSVFSPLHSNKAPYMLLYEEDPRTTSDPRESSPAAQPARQLTSASALLKIWGFPKTRDSIFAVPNNESILGFTYV